MLIYHAEKKGIFGVPIGADRTDTCRSVAKLLEDLGGYLIRMRRYLRKLICLLRSCDYIVAYKGCKEAVEYAETYRLVIIYDPSAFIGHGVYEK